MAKTAILSQEFRVEKNVPIPLGGWGDHKYPFRTMEVGDSFSIEKPNLTILRRVRASACQYGMRTQTRFSVLKDPKKPGSYRCWRRE